MRITILIITLCLTLPLYGKALNVTFIIPDKEGTFFWKLVNSVNAAAAKDLNINLETIYSDTGRFAQISTIKEVASRAVKPDYIIFRGYFGNTIETFKLLETKKIPFITLEQKFTDIEAKELGNPQGKFQYWLGQIIYDNQAGGELLLNSLIASHSKKHPNKPIYITGIGGDVSSLAKERQQALINIDPTLYKEKITLNQIFTTYWRTNTVKERFVAMSKRYPETNIYWCAGDELALTVLTEHKKNLKTPAIIGGFDWVPQALEKIKNKELTASVGGHFLMVTSAMLKIIDYDNGINRFISPPFLHQFELITQENVNYYLTFINEKKWQDTDFSLFLHTKNKNALELNIQSMIEQQSLSTL